MSFIIENFMHGTPRVVRPWDLPDPNPMPFVVCSDRLDRALAYWDEARWAVRVAGAVLRYGYEYEDHLRCGDHR